MGWALGGKQVIGGSLPFPLTSSVLILYDTTLVGGAQRGGQQQRLNKALYQSFVTLSVLGFNIFFNWGELVVSAELRDL